MEESGSWWLGAHPNVPLTEEPFNTRTAESTHREASSSPAPSTPGQQEARPQVKVGREDKGLPWSCLTWLVKQASDLFWCA